MKTWLIDAGPFVAYLDANDPFHKRVSLAFDAEPVPMWTTMPVITEAMYLLRTGDDACSQLVGLLRDARTRIEGIAEYGELEQASSLMKKYRDVPMDFADASLVVLAEKLGLRDILTTDERGFRVFRIRGRQSFHLVLDDFHP